MASYQVDTDGGTYQVDTEEPSYLQDVVSNAGKEISAIPGQLPTMAKQAFGMASIPEDALKAIPQMLSGTNLADTSVAQDVAPIIAGNKNTLNTVEHPVDSFRKAPISTAGTFAGLLGGGLEGNIPEELPLPKVSIPEAKGPIPEVPPEAPPPGGGSGAAQPITEQPKTEQATPPPPSTEASPINNVSEKANDLKNYVSRGYEGFAKKPGGISDIADYLQSKSQMMAAEQMGATPLQARQIGHEGMRAIGQYAMDNDMVGPRIGLKGMRAKNTELLANAGKTLGDIRKEADATRNPLTSPIDVLQNVRQTLDQKYSRGAYSGEAGQYAKALQDVEDGESTFQGMADVATKLNKAANEANRLKQPHTPFTDVANIISKIENERIKQILPQKAALYEKALKDYGVNKKISEFINRKEGGEVKRLGPGSFTSNMIQKGMDEFGYKTGAKVMNRASTSILKNPSIASHLPSLFKEFVNQVEALGEDVVGMSEGGIVPGIDKDKEIGHYLSKQYNPKYELKDL